MNTAAVVSVPDRQTPDLVLAEAFLDGDEGAFRNLYRRHTPRLRMLSLRLCGGDDHVADDIVQETWIRACGGLPDFEWRSGLATWLCGITIRCAYETSRSGRRRERRERAAGEGHLAASAHIEGRASTIDLERALRRLPDRQRFVVVLHDVEGFTHAEIGQRLSIAEGTSKSDLFHGRRLLREILNGERRS